MITRYRDFGNLVIVRGVATGIVYLRMLPSTLATVHAELERVLARYSHELLMHAFVVVEPAYHRLRRLPEAPAGEGSVLGCAAFLVAFSLRAPSHLGVSGYSHNIWIRFWRAHYMSLPPASWQKEKPLRE
jgi:hypothetical protein